MAAGAHSPCHTGRGHTQRVTWGRPGRKLGRVHRLHTPFAASPHPGLTPPSPPSPHPHTAAYRTPSSRRSPCPAVAAVRRRNTETPKVEQNLKIPRALGSKRPLPKNVTVGLALAASLSGRARALLPSGALVPLTVASLLCPHMTYGALHLLPLICQMWEMRPFDKPSPGAVSCAEGHELRRRGSCHTASPASPPGLQKAPWTHGVRYQQLCPRAAGSSVGREGCPVAEKTSPWVEEGGKGSQAERRARAKARRPGSIPFCSPEYQHMVPRPGRHKRLVG